MSITSTNNKGLDAEASFWSRKYKIHNFDTNARRWNKGWEKALRDLPAKDVYLCMSYMYNTSVGDAKNLPSHSGKVMRQVSQTQDIVVSLWETFQRSELFVTAWLLLNEEERRRHLTKGMEEACRIAELGQDTRSLCPELTIAKMLKQNGRAFPDFFEAYTKGKKGVKPNVPYAYPSEWWEAVEKIPTNQPALSQSEKLAYKLLTLQRNHFISQFFVHSSSSIFNDIVAGSAEMTPVLEFIKTQGVFAQKWAQSVSSIRPKPAPRCENCTQSQQEIGPDAKFMTCSGCKSNLQFTVHYCSRECQREDWPEHKRHCGKKKVEKPLQGTAHDYFLSHPSVPDHLRHIPSIRGGDFDITSLGFGSPSATAWHSAALKRQVSRLTANKETDYIIFGTHNRGTSLTFRMPDRIAFRILRADIFTSVTKIRLGMLAEHLLESAKTMPGMSRRKVIAQLKSEYGMDVEECLELVQNGDMAEGGTFLQQLYKNLHSGAVALADLGHLKG